MKHLRITFSILIFVVFVLSAGVVVADDEKHGYRTYAVTITNVTRGQIFSPPIIFSHRGNFKLFELGAPASKQLYPLAEDGDYAPLVELLTDAPNVFDYTAADPTQEGSFILPGKSLTLKVTARGSFRYLTVASMLVSTNDAFLALQRYALPFRGSKRTVVSAYDVGSEVNSEMCEYIPGPPCGNGGIRNADGAEGFVHIHAGIHGGGDLMPAEADWNNPVAAITVRAIRN